MVAKTDAEKAAAIEYTPVRKLREARMALNLEQTESKDEILERYLNTVAFAPSVYGIEAASEYFYGKHASQLDLQESATLAGMVNNPNKYNPFTENGAELVPGAARPGAQVDGPGRPDLAEHRRPESRRCR